MLDWQKWVTIEAGKYKADGRPAHPLVCVVVARQNGKTTLMKSQILANLFMYQKKLQIGTAHRLTTSLETFRDLVNIIEENDELAKKVKRIRWAHGSEEIELLAEHGGGRYMVKAGASAARGISKPELVHIDETRELKDESTWASLRYTMMAAEAPQLWTYSNAGDQHSVILNQLRERGMVAAAGGADDIFYAEWSSHTDDISNVEGWRQSNPSLGQKCSADGSPQYPAQFHRKNGMSARMRQSISIRRSRHGWQSTAHRTDVQLLSWPLKRLATINSSSSFCTHGKIQSISTI
jgi:phage terminase large subunit-like protein